MPDVRPLSPELSRSVSTLARALVAASRSWALYPADHPSVRAAIDRVRSALTDAASGGAVSFAVTPDTLLVEGTPVATDGPVTDAAQWLHQHDILQLTFAGDVPGASLQALLSLLSRDIAEVRAAGGPASIWRTGQHGGITVTQIDYTSVFDSRGGDHPARQKDDLWRSIVRAVVDRRSALDEAAQKRLLEIAGDAVAIGELAEEVRAPSCAADGSPMLTSQAAAVMAAYRHLVATVNMMDPGRRAEAMRNVAAATAAMDPPIVLQMMSGASDPASADVRAGLAAGFDDLTVAQLLATTLATEGRASNRLAAVFETIAPDEPRKRRVLTLTRTLLTETAFGKSSRFDSLWMSMEELLLAYNEKPFVSSHYRAGLDEVGARAEAMATDVPPELLPLLDTLGQDNIRRLSVTLLVDLLQLEIDPARAPGLARDVAALAEDLLLSGDYASAVIVTRALAGHASGSNTVTQSTSRAALDALVDTAAFHETVELLEQMTTDDADRFAGVCAAIGPAATDALRRLLEAEIETTGRRRAAEIIRGYGGRAATRLAPLLRSPDWYTVRNAAELLGQLGSADAVPLLQPLLRGGDPRVMRSAVRALAGIHHPGAARAVHTVLRAATGEQRQAVVTALVEHRDPRVIPVLVCILNESDPLGRDHQLVLETLDAVARIGRDEAIPHVASVMRRHSWLARKKARSLKTTSIAALKRMGSPAATRAIVEAAETGDRVLRKLARAATSTHA